MDSRLNSVLQAIIKLGEENNFVVISADEIKNMMIEHKDITNKELDEAILYLKKRSFIQLKYSSSNTYCFALLSKAVVYNEDGINSLNDMKVVKEVVQKKDKLLFIKVFLGSFLGAAIGAGLAVYLMSII